MAQPASSVTDDELDVGDHDDFLMAVNLKRSFGLPNPEEGEGDHLRWLVTALAAQGEPEAK